MERICNALERWTNYVPSSVVLQLFYDEMNTNGPVEADLNHQEMIPTVVNSGIPEIPPIVTDPTPSGSNQPLIIYDDTDTFEETFDDTLSQSRNFVESLKRLTK